MTPAITHELIKVTQVLYAHCGLSEWQYSIWTVIKEALYRIRHRYLAHVALKNVHSHLKLVVISFYN